MKCLTCKREMDVPGQPDTMNCGGDCARCSAPVRVDITKEEFLNAVEGQLQSVRHGLQGVPPGLMRQLGIDANFFEQKLSEEQDKLNNLRRNLE